MDSDKLQRMSRRNFMENLAAVGVSAPAINGLSQDEISNYDLESEVPYIKAKRTTEKQPGEAPVRELVYDTIDREEWERREAALNVRDRVQSALDEHFEDQPIHASFGGDEQSPIDFGVGIEVQRDERLDYDLEDIEDAFPTELQGIRRKPILSLEKVFRFWSMKWIHIRLVQ